MSAVQIPPQGVCGWGTIDIRARSSWDRGAALRMWVSSSTPASPHWTTAAPGGRQDAPPQGCPHLNPQNLWTSSVTWQKVTPSSEPSCRLEKRAVTTAGPGPGGHFPSRLPTAAPGPLPTAFLAFVTTKSPRHLPLSGTSLDPSLLPLPPLHPTGSRMPIWAFRGRTQWDPSVPMTWKHLPPWDLWPQPIAWPQAGRCPASRGSPCHSRPRSQVLSQHCLHSSAPQSGPGGCNPEGRPPRPLQRPPRASLGQGSPPGPLLRPPRPGRGQLA